MANDSYHDSTCKVRTDPGGKEADAVVAQFEEHNYLNVVINKAVKVNLKWNSRCYEGRAAGLDFVSDGPKISRLHKGR